MERKKPKKLAGDSSSLARQLYEDLDQCIPEHLKKYQHGIEILVEESVIGLVFGIEGRSLKKIMNITGASIEIDCRDPKGGKRTVYIESFSPPACPYGNSSAKATGRVCHAYKLIESMRLGALKKLRQEHDIHKEYSMTRAGFSNQTDFRNKSCKDDKHPNYRVFSFEASDHLLKAHVPIVADYLKP